MNTIIQYTEAMTEAMMNSETESMHTENIQHTDTHYIHETIKLKLQMRKLWMDHAIWVRGFIVDLLADLPSIDYTIERLLKNQDQMGNCFRSFFGDVATDNIISLLREHITIAMNLLKAIRSGNINAVALEEQWIKNSENISILFATILPCYSKDELIDMFSTCMIMTKYQFIARMDGDYNADIMYFDMGLHHVVTISDYLSNGLIEYFFED
jgi:hypothetical protein